MADLTDDELRFLYTQRIDESAVMDCSWMRPRRYKWAMEEEGCRPLHGYRGAFREDGMPATVTDIPVDAAALGKLDPER